MPPLSVYFTYLLAAFAAFSSAYSRRPQRRSAGDSLTQSNSVPTSNLAFSPSFDWTSTLNPNTTQSQHVSLERRDASFKLPLKRNKKNTLWIAPVKFGTPRSEHDIQLLDILFSTSSKISRVGSCAGFSNTYHPDKSSSAEPKSEYFYLDDKHTKDPYAKTYSDIVHVTDQAKTRMEFGVVTDGTQLDTSTSDGVISLSPLKHLPAEFCRQNLFGSPFLLEDFSLPAIFAFNIHADRAEILFGNSNIAYIESFPIMGTGPTAHLWTMRDKGEAILGNYVVKNVVARIDSGTPMIYGPRDGIRSIYSQVLGVNPIMEPGGYYKFSCKYEISTDLHFKWKDYLWTVSHKDFIYSQDKDKDECRGIFAALQYKARGHWILGQRFMKGKAIEFDGVAREIRFRNAF